MAEQFVPATTKKSTARDFFVYLAATASLYFSVGALIALLFEYVKRIFPDNLVYWYDPYQGPARFAIATLIVVFPLFLYFTRKLNRDLRTEESRMELPVRRWLLYLTLFAAGFALAVDLVVLIYTFLGGEDLTAAFLSKVAIVFVIVAGVFYYYLQDLKGKWRTNEAGSKMFGAGVSAFVLISIIAGFFIMGSPQEMRKLRFDQQRVNDLSSIQSYVTNYYVTKQRLPENLAELNDPLTYTSVPVDPETGAAYTYRKNDALGFSVCATFALPSIDDASSMARDPYGESWQHASGETCFDRTVDPERFPPVGKPIAPTSVPVM